MLAFLLSNSHRNFPIFHHTILRNLCQELSPMYGEHGPDSTGFFGRDPPSILVEQNPELRPCFPFLSISVGVFGPGAFRRKIL